MQFAQTVISIFGHFLCRNLVRHMGDVTVEAPDEVEKRLFN